MAASSATPAQQSVQQRQDNASLDAWQEARGRWRDAMQALRVPGLAVVVVSKGEVLFIETSGVRNLDGQAVTPDTIFYIGSCTKPLTATLVAQLAAEGKLELDAPVIKYLPQFAVADEELTHTLTVRDLLCHRQGLNSGAITLLDAYTGEITDERYYHFLKMVRPTRRVDYSNVHFTLAARIVEKLEGQGWREVMQQRLFDPAGMTRTTGYASRMYGDKDAAVPMEVHGEAWVASTVRKTDRTMHAAGGTGMSVRDLGVWLRLNLGNGQLDGARVLSEEAATMVRELQAELVKNSPFPGYRLEGYGLGWEVATLQDHRVIRHTGGYAGATAIMAFVPEKQIGVGVLVNSSGEAVKPLTEIIVLDALCRLLEIEAPDLLSGLVADAREPAEQVEGDSKRPLQDRDLSLPLPAYAGTYQNEHWGTIRVDEKSGTLVMSLGDLEVRPEPAAIDAFKFEIEWGSPASRFIIENGRVVAVMVSWPGYSEARFDRS